jgi:hypothetical protein
LTYTLLGLFKASTPKGHRFHPSESRRHEGEAPEEDDGHRKSSKLSKRCPRPSLAAMAALNGCAMVEFKSYAFIILGMASVVMV